MKRPENRDNGTGAQMDLLELQVDSIAFPAPNTQPARIGFSMLGGAILNSSDLAQSSLETTKLTSRISDLIIKFGWLFICKSPATRIKSNGKPQRVMFYRIPTDVAQAMRKQPRVKAWLAACRKAGS